MKKTLFAAAIAVASIGLPSIALADSGTFYDPAESEWIILKSAPNPANAAAARADMERYASTQTYFDPAEGEYVTVKTTANPTIITTHDAPVASSSSTSGGWDPAE